MPQPGQRFLMRLKVQPSFSVDNMLLVVSIGLKPEEFLEAMKQLVVLQDVPKAVLRHQEEFERLTEG